MNRLRLKTVWPGDGRVTYLAGASTEAIELALESMPDDAPVVVVYYASAEITRSLLVESILRQLEQGAVRLYPAWLPGAEQLEGPGGAGIAAVRALASRRASQTGHFGPFLADLAEHALRGNGKGTTRFAPEVRATELSKVLAAGYGREAVAILIDVPGGLDERAQHALTSVAEWFAAHGNWGVWLAGAPLPGAERIGRVEVELPPHVAEIAEVPPPPQALPPERDVVVFPALQGVPRSDSPSEVLLESELARQPWAAGRKWNRKYPPLPDYIIDLIWLDDFCAVEIDGHEHRNRLKFEQDRRRDVDLQLKGFAVLRFTNEQVQTNVAEVVGKIEQFLRKRRANVFERLN